MLDLLINAAYVFGFASYIASAGTEAISSYFRWRAKMLLDALMTMLNERVTGLATAIYRHPLVHPRTTGEDSGDLTNEIPSYIDPKSFAIALIDALGLDQSCLAALKGMGLQQIAEWARTQIAPLQNEPRLRMLLTDAIHRNNADLELVRLAIAGWFDTATDRISGAYKRRTQASNFTIGLILAVVLDLNPLPREISDMIQWKPMATARFAPPNVSATSSPASTNRSSPMPLDLLPPVSGGVTSPVAPVVTPTPTGVAPIGGSSAGTAKGWSWDYAKVTNIRGTGTPPSPAPLPPAPMMVAVPAAWTGPPPAPRSNGAPPPPEPPSQPPPHPSGSTTSGTPVGGAPYAAPAAVSPTATPESGAFAP
jgi:hypothetical protein